MARKIKKSPSLNKKLTLVRALILLFAFATFLYIGYSLFKIVTTTAPDFSGFYKATVYLLHHMNPYNPKTGIIIIPPQSMLFFVPFSLLPYQIAQTIFVMLSAITVPIIIFISVKLIYKEFSYYTVLFFTSLAFIAFPTKFNLGMGQVNLFALMFFLVGYYLYRKELFTTSGIFIAIAFLIKPILVFMILFFILQRAWKTILAIAVTGVFFVVLSLMLFGISVDFYYVQVIIPHLLGSTEGREVYYNQGFMGFISRLTQNLLFRKYSSSVFDIVILLSSIIIIQKQKFSEFSQLAIFFTMLLLVHTLAWQHQFVFLIFPFIYIVSVVWKKMKYFLLGLVLFAYLLVSWNFKNPSLYIHFPENLLLSHTFFGAVLLFILLFYTQLKQLWEY